MSKTSRQRILEYIQKRESVTAREIAAAFRMTAANARHHLSALTEEGVVIIAGLASGESLTYATEKGPGRPELRYQLRIKAHAHNLENLASALLRIFTEKLEDDEFTDILAKQLCGGKVETKNVTLRLQQIVRRLDAMNYRPRWEAHVDAPRVVFGHCPYANILDEHPEMCKVDEKILAYMVDGSARQTARLEEVQPGVYQCVFKVLI